MVDQKARATHSQRVRRRDPRSVPFEKVGPRKAPLGGNTAVQISPSQGAGMKKVAAF